MTGGRGPQQPPPSAVGVGWEIHGSGWDMNGPWWERNGPRWDANGSQRNMNRLHGEGNSQTGELTLDQNTPIRKQ